jgi:GMP synthase (glutamine-hydrolysing)
MRKILVFQHVAHEILGTLNPLLKQRGFRIKYVNFDRHPDSLPSMEKYDGLIVLGGYMGAYQTRKFPHLRVEMKCIEEALKKNAPVLGICLGAQMLAKVLGAKGFQAPVPEIGWSRLQLTPQGKKDGLFKDFKNQEVVFQLHQDTFEMPRSVKHLARSKMFESQAFRAGENAYGLQYHLEVDRAMVRRWLEVAANKKMVEKFKDRYNLEDIRRETDLHIERSLALSTSFFEKFVDLFGEFDRYEVVGSGHKI